MTGNRSSIHPIKIMLQPSCKFPPWRTWSESGKVGWLNKIKENSFYRPVSVLGLNVSVQRIFHQQCKSKVDSLFSAGHMQCLCGLWWAVSTKKLHLLNNCYFHTKIYYLMNRDANKMAVKSLKKHVILPRFISK